MKSNYHHYSADSFIFNTSASFERLKKYDSICLSICVISSWAAEEQFESC